MDWQTKVDDTLPNLESTKHLLAWLEEFQFGDKRLIKVLASNGVLSFPHTVLSYSGEMVTRVVTSLYASGVDQVVALGVIHMGVLPEPYKKPFAELLDPEVDPRVRKKHLSIFQGAFIRSEKETPFGTIPIIKPKNNWETIKRDDDLLANEF